jgi:hypothetical protein
MTEPTHRVLVRLQLKNKAQQDVYSSVLGRPSAFPQIGDTVSLDGIPIGGCYRVTALEWQVVEDTLTQVKVIAVANS